MKKPLIGITCYYNEETYETKLAANYIESISKSGGIPILLCCTEDEALLEEWSTLCDGLMLTGGPDINPEIYGERPHHQTNAIAPMRDKTESLLFELFKKQNKPIFAICRGAQLINTLMGGKLCQDIPSIIGDTVIHRIPNLVPASHNMKFSQNTKLHNTVGVDEIKVNSYHHQCISEVAKGLKAVAFAPDGIIEAIESTDESWILGVQWHPERNLNDDNLSKKLFSAFVEACKK